MKPPLQQIPKTFSVEQSYNLAMCFFLEIWSLIEPKILEEDNLTGIYTLFFLDVCCHDEYCAEWNEAVRRVKNVPKKKQYNLKLTEEEVFLCAIEFCRLHNRHYENQLAYAVCLIESMLQSPKSHSNEWKMWNDVVDRIKNKYMNSKNFNWATDNAWPYE